MATDASALNKQLIPVAFQGGLDTKTAKQLVLPGKFLVLENCIRRQGNQISKRFGFKKLGKMILSGGSITSGSRLAVFRDDLLLLNASQILSYTASADAWIDKGQVTSILVNSEPVIRNSYEQFSADMATAAGITVTVYQDSRGGSRVCVTDDDTDSSVLYDIQLNANASLPKVCVIGSYFMIGYVTSSNQLISRRIPIVNPVALSNETVVLGTGVAVESWDMDPMASFQAAVFAVNTTANHVTYGYIAQSGAVGSPAINGLPGVGSILEPAHSALTVSCDAINGRFYVSYYATSNQHVRLMAATSDFITRYFINVEDVSTFGDINTIGMCIQNNFSLRMYYDFTITPAYNNFVRSARSNWNVVSAPVIAENSQLIRSVGLATKPFVVGDHQYVTCAFQSELQSTYFTIQDDSYIVTRMQAGLGAGINTRGLPRVSSNDTNSFIFPLGVVSRLQANADLTVSSDNIGQNKTTLKFNAAAFHNDTLGLNQHISGGLLLAYDGVSATELGFNVFPEDISLAVASGTSTFPSVGQYSYRVVYEWVDGKGQIHRSVPSTLKFASISSTTQTISVKIPMLRLTAKTGARANAKIVIYRSDVDLDTVLYRLTDIDNNPAVDSVTYVDDNADGVGLTSREILYTTGGVLENTAPPASKVVHKHKNRLFLAGLENGNTISYSKEHVDGEGVSFSDTLQITVDPLGGDITGLATLDDKLVIFKKDRIFIVSGDGPVDTGAQNDYTLPQLVSGDVGTTNPESIVIMPNGVMFQSDKGIWLLSRQLDVTYIGAGVEEFNNETVTSALILETENEVRFTTEAGNALIYNYYFSQWSTFTNYSAQSAVSALSTYLHLKPDGTVNAETPDLYEDSGARIRMAIETGWFSFSGVQGYQRIYWVSVLGDFLSHCITSVKLAYNFENVYNQPRYFDTRTGLMQDTFGSGGTFGSETPLAGHSSSVYQFRIKPSRQKCEAMKMRIEDIDTLGINGGASFNLTHMAFVVGTKSGSQRLRASKTIGK